MEHTQSTFTALVEEKKELNAGFGSVSKQNLPVAVVAGTIPQHLYPVKEGSKAQSAPSIILHHGDDFSSWSTVFSALVCSAPYLWCLYSEEAETHFCCVSCSVAPSVTA